MGRAKGRKQEKFTGYEIQDEVAIDSLRNRTVEEEEPAEEEQK